MKSTSKPHKKVSDLTYNSPKKTTQTAHSLSYIFQGINLFSSDNIYFTKTDYADCAD